MAEREDGAIRFLGRMVESAVAAEIGSDEGRPRQELRAYALLPYGQLFLPVGTLGAQTRFQFGDGAIEVGDLFLLSRSVNPRLRLVGVVEKREEPEIYIVRD